MKDKISHLIHCPKRPTALPVNTNLLPSITVCFASQLYTLQYAQGNNIPKLKTVTIVPIMRNTTNSNKPPSKYETPLFTA